MKKPTPGTTAAKSRESQKSRKSADRRRVKTADRDPGIDGQSRPAKRRCRPRTLARLRAEAPSHIRFDFARIETRRVAGGPRRDKWVANACCTLHWQPIPDITYGHMSEGRGLCLACYRYNGSLETRRERLYWSSEGKIIGHLLRSNMTDTGSIFECVSCGHVWTASLNNLLTRDNRQGTGCPGCYRLQKNKREAEVEAMLVSAGLRRVPMQGNLFASVRKLKQARGDAFATQVSIDAGEASRRALSLDFLIKRAGKLFGLEVDGPHHYRMRFFDYSDDDFARVAQLDCAKVAQLGAAGIEIRRIPLPLLTHGHTLDALLMAVLDGSTPYIGIPDPEWIPERAKKRTRKG